MEYTASISTMTEQTFTASVPKVNVKSVFAGITAPAWLFLIQAACYFLQAKVGHIDGAGDAIPFIGALASALGIYMGIRLSQEGAAARGLNCALVSMTALLFWSAQIFLRHVPLFA